MLLANQDREEGRNGSPFAPVAGSPDAPEGIRAGPRNGSPRTTQQNEEHNRTSCPQCIGVLPMLPANRERKPTRKEGTREWERGKEERSEAEPATSPQAHKRGTPPYCNGQAAVPLITNSRQKISKKSPWVDLKKFSEKFFVGMFRGQRKTPCVVSTEGGCLTNENREISNLAMQITKNAQKHYLITKGKGR